VGVCYINVRDNDKCVLLFLLVVFSFLFFSKCGAGLCFLFARLLLIICGFMGPERVRICTFVFLLP
jgi:hypothetical protein